MRKQDYADSEIKGIRRYIPTTIAFSLVLSLVTIPFIVFKFIVENSQIFNNAISNQSLIAFICALISALIISILLIFELASINNQAKHRRIVHYINEHPLMTIGWLIQNSSLLKIFYVVLLLMFIFFIGLFTGMHF